MLIIGTIFFPDLYLSDTNFVNAAFSSSNLKKILLSMHGES